MNQVEFERIYNYESNKDEIFLLKFKRELTIKNVIKSLLSIIPSIKWIQSYSFLTNFQSDLIAGFTVGIMIVPQGMAYATLAGLLPIYGLYSCFFAIFIYMFFGSSKHISVGTFAVASMMVDVVQSKLINEFYNNESINEVKPLFDFEITPIIITTSLSFFVGLFQLITCFFRLSFLTCYLSDPLISAFTTGSAIYVFISQIPKILGVNIPRQSGYFLNIKYIYQLYYTISTVNLFTILISTFGITFLLIGKEFINPIVRKRTKIILPLELILILISILISKIFNLNKKYHVKIVAHVPKGIPSPALPKFELLPYLWTDAILIGIICYIFVYSMGKIFAKKHKYQIDSNQELYALGLIGIISSFFPVYPVGASLSRSSLCEITGAKTKGHALFSSAVLLVVILWLGPFLESLPIAILACIVIVSLKSLFLQFNVLPKLWKISLADFIVWITTFLVTTFFDVTFGLIFGILVVILSVVVREQCVKIEKLGSNANFDIFKSAAFYKNLTSTFNSGHIVILKFNAPLHFANSAKLIKHSLNILNEIKITKNSPPKIDSLKKKKTKLKQSNSKAKLNKSTTTLNSLTQQSSIKDINDNLNLQNLLNDDIKLNDIDNIALSNSGILIIDGSCISYIDSTGVDTLIEIFNDGLRLSIVIKFAEFTDSVLNVLNNCNFFTIVPKTEFYPSIKDAFLSIKNF